MWQSLVTGGSTKCDQCMAVCPAGEEVIVPFLENRKLYVKRVVEPFRKKVEKVYVVPGSDAGSYAASLHGALAHKKIRQVGNGLRPNTVSDFLDYLPMIFQRGKAVNLNATYHLTSTGAEEIKATVAIRDKKIERKLARLLISAKVRIKGPPKLLLAFGSCFPS